MSVEEQKKIAFDQGRLAAWQGRLHHGTGAGLAPEFRSDWYAGAEAQCKVMSDAAAKVPLLFADERAVNPRADKP